MNIARNLEIDRLRAFAVLMTIWAHLDILMRYRPKVYEMIYNHLPGTNGVILFFAISGYVISKTFIPHFVKAYQESAQAIKSVLAVFWVKRIYRIVPAASFWAIFLLLASLIFNQSNVFGSFHINIGGAISSIFYCFNFYNVLHDHGRSIYGVYWSLAVEEQFYIIFPLFLIAVVQFISPAKIYIPIAALFILSIMMNLLPPDIRAGLRCEAIIYGVMLFLLMEYGGKYAPKLQKFVPTYRLAMILSIALLLLLGFADAPLTAYLPIYLFEPTPALISVIIVWLAALNKGFIFPYQKSIKFLDWIGTRSYSLYLVHIPAFDLTAEIVYRFNTHRMYIKIILGVLLCYLLAEASYKWLETPLRNKGRTLARKIEKEGTTIDDPLPSITI